MAILRDKSVSQSFIHPWQTIQLSDLCEQIADCPHSTPLWTDSGVVVLRNQNIRHGRLNLSSPSYTDEFHFEERSRRARLRPGDLVLTREAPMGEVCMVPEGLRCCLGQRMVMVRPNPDRCDPRYLLYALQSPGVQHSIKLSEGTGATVSNLRIPHLKALPIPNPPIKDQKEIARILSSLDDKIELNRRMNATLEAMARALFKAWFVDFEPVHANRENRPSTSASPEIAKLFPSEFENGIPKGWELRKLSDLVNVVKGRSYTSKELSESENALVTLKSFIRGGGYKSNGLKPYTGTFKPEQRIEDGEIIVACTDVTQAAEVIGRAALFQSNHEFRNYVASLDVQIVRPKEADSSLFYYHLMRSDDYVSHVLSFTSGTTVLHLAKDAIQRYDAIDPGMPLVRIYSDFMKPVFEKISLNQNEGILLSTLRDSLLPRLISGKLSFVES